MRLFQMIGNMLSPSKHVCLSCKQASNLNEEHLGLCPTCYHGIPWIVDVLCPVCGRYEECHDCKRRDTAYFQKNRSAVRYDDAMKELLARYKYRGDERLKSVLGGMLVHSFRQIRRTQTVSRDSRHVITFVPVSGQRYMERGFNQAEQMARELGSRVGVPVISMLQRVRHTDKQSFKTRSDRLDDLEHVFEADIEGIRSCKELQRDAGASLIVYVVDDVYTTGSTMNQCARVLSECMEADYFGITWAR